MGYRRRSCGEHIRGMKSAPSPFQASPLHVFMQYCFMICITFRVVRPGNETMPGYTSQLPKIVSKLYSSMEMRLALMYVPVASVQHGEW